MKASPIQIAQHCAIALSCREVAHEVELVAGVAPRGAVVDQPVDPGPKLLVQRFWKLLLPPHTERQIGVQVRENNIRKRPGAVAVEAEGDLLRADLTLTFSLQVAMRTDPGLGFGFLRIGLGQDQDRPARVLTSDGRDHLRVGGEGGFLFGVDDEIDEGCTRL